MEKQIFTFRGELLEDGYEKLDKLVQKWSLTHKDKKVYNILEERHLAINKDLKCDVTINITICYDKKK